MNGIEQRRARRISRNELPETLHRLSMVFGSGRRIEVETYDASTRGLGLVAPIGLAEFEDDVAVTLEPEDRHFQLSGEIVFAIGHRPGESRVGVQLTQSIEIGKYHALLGEDSEAQG